MFDEKFLAMVLDAIKNTIQQGEQCMNTELDMCAYRANGLKCVVGWMIPDDQYTHEMEGAQIHFREDIQDVLGKVLGKPLTQMELQFLTSIQVVHDNFNPLTGYEGSSKLFIEHFIKESRVCFNRYDLLDRLDVVLKESGYEYAQNSLN